ncbi:Transmembrane_domain-containing protein [Hexamita inflata]|uniref:Transmembrane domain-containing protein n=1 Tax=Hexamita inflata TaxID=28002 RepID=A0AA86U0T3_9EUKA|nr:Transmembrane domain-containing protein [Hexamita inflata]
MRFECGQISPIIPQINQKETYWQMAPVKNLLYENTHESIFNISFSQVEGYMMLQTTELLQLLSINYKIELNASQFVQLLKYNSLPEKCIASLELLNILKPCLNADEALTAILFCLTQRVQREQFDDQLIIQVQHVFSKIFNDRSPNQRAAMACAWSVITEMKLVDQKYINQYFIAMVSGDTKMYETVLRQLKNKEPNSLLQATCWILARSPALMKDSSYEQQIINYRISQRLYNKYFNFDIIDYDTLVAFAQRKASELLKLMDVKSTTGICIE